MAQILTFGLTTEQINLLEQMESKNDLTIIDCYIDLMALPSDLAIINPDALTSDEAMTLVSYYREIDPSIERVVIVGKSSLFENISFAKVIPDFFDEEYDRATVLMNTLNEVKRGRDKSRLIINTMRLLKLIEENPGITTGILAEKTGLSESSVKRYIRDMQEASILIVYRDEGWHCLMDPEGLI